MKKTTQGMNAASWMTAMMPLPGVVGVGLAPADRVAADRLVEQLDLQPRRDHPGEGEDHDQGQRDDGGLAVRVERDVSGGHGQMSTR